MGEGQVKTYTLRFDDWAALNGSVVVTLDEATEQRARYWASKIVPEVGEDEWKVTS